MTLLPIVTYPNLILKKPSKAVDQVSALVRTLIRDMFETMYDANGVGLAAIQVAKPECILVIDVGKMRGETHEPHPICLINPEIVQAEGRIVFEEGCLSCPELHVPMERAASIVVTGLDEAGKLQTLQATELLAVAVQHEMDHLNGKLLVDQLSRLKRERYRKDLMAEALNPEGKSRKSKGSSDL